MKKSLGAPDHSSSRTGLTMAALLALKLAGTGCATVPHVPPAGPLGIDGAPTEQVDPEIAACTENFGTRADIGSLLACLEDVPRIAAAPAEINLPTGLSLSVETQDLAVRLESVSDNFMASKARIALDERVENEGANIRFSGRRVTLEPSRPLNLSSKNARPLGMGMRSESTRLPDGTMVIVTRKDSFDYGDHSRVDWLSEFGYWDKVDIPGAAESEMIASVNGVPDSDKLVVIFGDNMHGVDLDLSPMRGSKLVVGAKNQDTWREVRVQSSEGHEINLNGGFVALDQDTWMVSSFEGLILTRDGGETWNDVPFTPSQGREKEDSRSFYVHEKGGDIFLSVHFRGHSFENYRLSEDRAQWIYAGSGNADEFLDPVSGLETEEGEFQSWEVEREDTGTYTYIAENLFPRKGQAATQEVTTNSGEVNLFARKTDAEGVPHNLGDTTFLTYKIGHRLAIEPLDLHVSPDGDVVTFRIVDHDLEVGGAGYKGNRLFVAHVDEGEVEVVEVVIPNTAPHGVSAAQIISGILVVTYDDNSDGDSRNLDLKMTTIPVSDLWSNGIQE
ncbi:MAG: hypothetical protein Q8P27_01855 [Candidatus Peregrinibacteria bacterium]|nr:hypothetical protein [Candidatus Peregrinibacteria bacterium]